VALHIRPLAIWGLREKEQRKNVCWQYRSVRPRLIVERAADWLLPVLKTLWAVFIQHQHPKLMVFFAEWTADAIISSPTVFRCFMHYNHTFHVSILEAIDSSYYPYD